MDPRRTLFDAKIIHMQPATAMAVIRDLADDGLRGRLEAAGFPAAPDGSGVARLAESRLVLALRGERVGLKQAGRKPGERTLEKFEKLTEFSSKDDAALNRLLGKALQGLGLIRGFEAEKQLSIKEKRSGDLLCQTDTGPVLLEFMWRRRTTRGEIAKYVLTKLAHYGKNLGFLD